MKYKVYHGFVKTGKVLHGIGDEVELTEEQALKRSGFVCLPEDFDKLSQEGVGSAEVMTLKTDLQSKDDELLKTKEIIENLKLENKNLKISNSQLKSKTKGDK